jgi:hypothetical protein
VRSIISMSELSPFTVNTMKTEILVTPSEETALSDLKQGEIDPVIKWNFAWSYEKRNFVTRYVTILETIF